MKHFQTGEQYPPAMCYISPFKQKRNGDPLWIQEVHLEPFDMDDGFQFEDDWHVWFPIHNKEPSYGNAYA